MLLRGATKVFLIVGSGVHFAWPQVLRWVARRCPEVPLLTIARRIVMKDFEVELKLINASYDAEHLAYHPKQADL